MTDVDPDLLAMLDGVFADEHENFDAAAGRASSTAPPASGTADGEPRREEHVAASPESTAGFWQRLDDLGLVRLTGRESSGGSGAGWFEAAELIRAAVRHAVRVPLAEHDLLACWLLASLGQPVDTARRTVCELTDGVATQVPGASAAERIVVVTDDLQVVDADAADLRITPGTNLIGESRDTVAGVPGPGVAADPALVDQLRLRAALVRAIQVSAALDRTLELSVTHARERIQFGRPLAKFQAVQHLIADIAAEAALARAATDAALASAATGTCSEFLVAMARSVVGHAASVVVRNAHQVHGAIGTTREHRLHDYTRAALAWRSEYGSVRFWDDEIARLTRDAGSDGLWKLIAD